MVDIIIKIIEPATNFDLLTKEELKLALSITDTTQDALLDQLIDNYSDVVAELCNRVFAKEKVMETWRELESRRVFLSHWPVKTADIHSVECPRGTVIPATEYELEEKSGKLSLFGSRAEPIVVTYTGGFNLPDEAPDALKQAAILMVQEDRAQAQRQATAGIRSLSHKEARVMFFDPNQGGGRGGGGSSAGVARAVHDLLMHYTRIEC